MKIHFYGTGDRSVGIWPIQVTMEVNIDKFDEEDRKVIRSEFRQLCEELFDDNASSVYFEDECADCHNLLSDDKRCHNECCISSEEFHKEDRE